MGARVGWIWAVITALLIPLVFGSFLYARSVEENSAKQSDVALLQGMLTDVKQTVEQNRRERNEELRRINDKLDALILQGKVKK